MAKRSIDDGRRIARRRMAGISFAVLVLITLASLWSILYSPERKEIAEALSAASIFLGGILASFVTIIGAYLGLSTTERLWPSASLSESTTTTTSTERSSPAGKTKEPWEGEGK